MLLDSENCKSFSSPDYNFVFNKVNGFFARWGKSMDDDPDFAPAPEILDFEITEVCEGPGGRPCPFCYKSNGPAHGTRTSFETAKAVIDKFPGTLTQVAFGVDAACRSNPDTFMIMEYARSKGVIPNVTVADVDEETARRLASVCGAVAVSRYADKDICYDSVARLVGAGQRFVNLHVMVSEETENAVWETMYDYFEEEPRLAGITAIVLLSLKRKGRGRGFTPLPADRFGRIVDFALRYDVPIGFDSCSYPKFESAIRGRKDYERLIRLAEPCESSCFSAYVNASGQFFPCSFVEGEPGWEEGIDVASCSSFVTDVWLHPRTLEFRKELLGKGRSCPRFEV
jgi:MoaA/NifB/PqqE/SkfB family radical SAM enzyme